MSVVASRSLAQNTLGVGGGVGVLHDVSTLSVEPSEASMISKSTSGYLKEKIVIKISHSYWIKINLLRKVVENLFSSNYS